MHVAARQESESKNKINKLLNVLLLHSLHCTAAHNEMHSCCCSMHNKVQCNHLKINNNDNVMQGTKTTAQQQQEQHPQKKNGCKNNKRFERMHFGQQATNLFYFTFFAFALRRLVVPVVGDLHVAVYDYYAFL